MAGFHRVSSIQPLDKLRMTLKAASTENGQRFAESRKMLLMK